MKLGFATRGLGIAVVLLLSACSSDDSGTGLLATTPVATTPTLKITGPDSVVSDSSQGYTVTALDGAGAPVAGISVTLTTSLGTIALSDPSAVTDADGVLAFSLSANKTGSTGTVTPVTGTATVVAKATVGLVALTDTKKVALTPTVFQFTSPNANTRVPLNTAQPLVLQWTSNGTAVSAPVTFTSKLGTLQDPANPDGVGTSLTVSTDASGFARLQVIASSSGADTITAVGGVGSSTTSLALTYVGEAAAFTAAAPSPINATSGASTITATVADASGNPVSGASVSFAISSAPSAGTLSPRTATTGSTGIAKAIYAANGASGTAVISVTVSPLATKNVTITIAP